MTKLATIIALLLIPSLVSCSRHSPNGLETNSSPTGACVFSVIVYQLSDQTQEFEQVTAVGGYDALVPCNFYSPDYLDINESLQIRTLEHDRDTVDFAVLFNDVEKSITATSSGAHVDFENGKWRVEIQIDTISLSPFAPNDKRLAAPVHVYITEVPWVPGGDNEKHIRNRKIVEKKRLTDKTIVSKIRVLLSDSNNFGMSGADCFHPRTAISFGTKNERTDVLFCRECSWIYVYSVDDKGKPFTLKYGLGQELRGLVNELRLEHFPNHVGE